MTSTHLTILRTIATHQPILKGDLYELLPMSNECMQVYLWSLKRKGYIQYGRVKGPVWLTVKGREVINEI